MWHVGRASLHGHGRLVSSTSSSWRTQDLSPQKCPERSALEPMLEVDGGTVADHLPCQDTDAGEASPDDASPRSHEDLALALHQNALPAGSPHRVTLQCSMQSMSCLFACALYSHSLDFDQCYHTHHHFPLVGALYDRAHCQPIMSMASTVRISVPQRCSMLWCQRTATGQE